MTSRQAEHTPVTLPWIERLNMLSINPDAATIGDIRKMAEECADRDEWIKANAPGGWIDGLRLQRDMLVRIIEKYLHTADMPDASAGSPDLADVDAEARAALAAVAPRWPPSKR